MTVVRALTLSAVALACVACGSATGAVAPSASQGPATPTPRPSPSPSPTSRYVVLPESCGALEYGADGNISPITCPDGRPNAAADTYLRSITPPLAVLALGPDASPSDVLAAMCGDMPHSTIPIESSAEELVQSENDWQFNGWGADYPTTYLVNGGCNG
jgi:hypothetical protein